MVEVVLLPGADADHRQALVWYQGRGAQAATGFEAAVEVALRAIGEAPKRWPLSDDRHRFYSLRRYPDSIFYRMEAERVLVVALAHASRADSYWRGRA